MHWNAVTLWILLCALTHELGIAISSGAMLVKFGLRLFIFLKVKWLLSAIIWQDLPLEPHKSFLNEYKNLSVNFQIIDRTNLTFVKSPEKCQNSETVIIVLSAPKNFERRQKIRKENESKCELFSATLLRKIHAIFYS